MRLSSRLSAVLSAGALGVPLALDAPVLHPWLLDWGSTPAERGIQGGLA
jgi:hypothetical protein